jgi:hypothetical protein
MIRFKPGGNSPGFLRECADGDQSSRPLELPSEATSQVSAMRMASARSMGGHDLTNKLQPFRRGPNNFAHSLHAQGLGVQKIPPAPWCSGFRIPPGMGSAHRCTSAPVKVPFLPTSIGLEMRELKTSMLIPRAFVCCSLVLERTRGVRERTFHSPTSDFARLALNEAYRGFNCDAPVANRRLSFRDVVSPAVAVAEAAVTSSVFDATSATMGAARPVSTRFATNGIAGSFGTERAETRIAKTTAATAATVTHCRPASRQRENLDCEHDIRRSWRHKHRFAGRRFRAHATDILVRQLLRRKRYQRG